ncbi:MAG TPA: hypothetical protein VFA39_20000 [Steroidobacteraceae bacterium]|nr:hypothetical protein [Steroidobacteraceae bacterium]
MLTKIQQSATRRQQTVKTHLDPLIADLADEIRDADPEAKQTLHGARKTLTETAREVSAANVRDSAAAMRQVKALWPNSHAYDGAVEYLDSLTRMAA